MPKELFPFRYRDAQGKWVRARYLAERHVIAARYKEWEVTGPPEIRGDGGYESFNPYRPQSAPRAAPPASNVDHVPELGKDERYLVLLFLRRYVTYCVRRGKTTPAAGAAALWREITAVCLEA